MPILKEQVSCIRVKKTIAKHIHIKSTQIPSLPIIRKKQSFSSWSNLQNYLSLLSVCFTPRFLTSAVCVRLIWAERSASWLQRRDSLSLVRWYSLAGVRLPMELQVPEQTWLLGVEVLQVSPLKTFLKPSVLRRIELRVALSCFLREVPEVTIIQFLYGKCREWNNKGPPNIGIRIRRLQEIVGEKDQATTQGKGVESDTTDLFMKERPALQSYTFVYASVLCSQLVLQLPAVGRQRRRRVRRGRMLENGG